MFDLTKKAFDLADKYRNPAIVLADAILQKLVSLGALPLPAS